MPQINNSVDERELIGWLEAVTGEDLNGAPLKDALKDGTVLCKAFNNLFPAYKVKWSQSSMPFKQMENIASFLKGASEVPGIKSFDLFMTVDLFEGKNMEQVKRCLMACKRVADKTSVLPSPVSPRETLMEKEFEIETMAEKKEEETNVFESANVSKEFNLNNDSYYDSGNDASKSNSYHESSIEDVAQTFEEQATIEEEKPAEINGIEVSYAEPEVIMPPDSPLENNYADVDEPAEYNMQ